MKKSKAFIIDEIVEYVPNTIVTKAIATRITGTISAIAVDCAEILKGKVSPFDTFIQLIDGRAEIVIDGESNLLETGQSIIIPAHSRHFIKSQARFKMVSTVIKSGYEDCQA